MANLADLEAKIVDLQAAVDAEQQQVADLVAANVATVEGLTAANAALQALVDVAPTPEQLQAVVDSIEAVKADIQTTV